MLKQPPPNRIVDGTGDYNMRGFFAHQNERRLFLPASSKSRCLHDAHAVGGASRKRHRLYPNSRLRNQSIRAKTNHHLWAFIFFQSLEAYVCKLSMSCTYRLRSEHPQHAERYRHEGLLALPCPSEMICELPSAAMTS